MISSYFYPLWLNQLKLCSSEFILAFVRDYFTTELWIWCIEVSTYILNFRMDLCTNTINFLRHYRSENFLIVYCHLQLRSDKNYVMNKKTFCINFQSLIGKKIDITLGILCTWTKNLNIHTDKKQASLQTRLSSKAVLKTHLMDVVNATCFC